jgi:hypothetical protein
VKRTERSQRALREAAPLCRRHPGRRSRVVLIDIHGHYCVQFWASSPDIIMTESWTHQSHPSPYWSGRGRSRNHHWLLCVLHAASGACVLSGDIREPRAQATRLSALIYGGNKEDDEYFIVIHSVPAISREPGTRCLARAPSWRSLGWPLRTETWTLLTM